MKEKGAFAFASSRFLSISTTGHATEITVVSIGPKQAQEVLRQALAMGADKAIHIQTDLRLDQVGFGGLIFSSLNTLEIGSATSLRCQGTPFNGRQSTTRSGTARQASH